MEVKIVAEFKARLRELREEKGLTKWEVASGLNNSTSPHTIRKYETEGENSKIKNVIALANFFDVTTDYLLGVSDEKHIDLSNIPIEQLLKEIKKRCE